MKQKYLANFIILLITIFVFNIQNIIAQDSGVFNSYSIINQGSNTYYYGSNDDGNNPALSGHDFGILNATSTLILSGGEISTWQKNGDESNGENYTIKCTYKVALTKEIFIL